MFCIQQVNDHDCGIAVSKMILANLNQDRNYLFLSSPYEESNNLSFYDLINFLKEYGVNAVASKVEDKSSIIELDKFPIIASVEKEGKSHAVYVYKINRNKIYYYDPSSSYQKLDVNDFNEIWTGYIIRIVDFTKTKCPNKPISLIKPVERLISILIMLLSSASGIIGVYYLNDQNPFYLPLIFLLFMMLGEIINKKYSLFLMKLSDKRMMEHFDSIKENSYYNFLKSYSDYKSISLVGDTNLVNYIMAILLISIILLINDRLNAIYIGVTLLISLVDILFIKPRIKNKENSIKIIEDELKQNSSKDSAYELMTNINKKSYDYGDYLVFYRYSEIFILFLINLLVMKLNNIFSITYMICYLFLEIYLLQNLKSLVSYPDNVQKKYNLLAKLNSLMEINSL